MQSGIRYIVIMDDDQERLQREFGDKHIVFGRNIKTHAFEAWYKPENSAPYKITTCENVWHAIKLLRARQAFENRRAKEILAEIDKHNDKLVTDKEEAAMHEVRHTMQAVASGKKTFMTPRARRTG